MKLLEYDYKILRTIKALRELRGVKQIVMAAALNVTRSTYTRIENGEQAITCGELKMIARELNTSVFQILAIADADDHIDFKMTNLSDILVRFVLMSREEGSRVDFTEEELEFIISKIKNFYLKNIGKDRKDTGI